MRSPPALIVELYTGKLEQGAHYTHQSATGNKATGQQRSLLATSHIHSGILRACGYEPIDGTTYHQWNIQLNGNEHTQGKSQSRNFATVEHKGYHSTNAIQQPWCTLPVHERRYHRCHGRRHRDRVLRSRARR